MLGQGCGDLGLGVRGFLGGVQEFFMGFLGGFMPGSFMASLKGSFKGSWGSEIRSLALNPKP